MEHVDNDGSPVNMPGETKAVLYSDIPFREYRLHVDEPAGYRKATWGYRIVCHDCCVSWGNTIMTPCLPCPTCGKTGEMG